MLSVAAIGLDPEGRVEQHFSSLLNPGVDPGPTHVHGLTAELLEGQPRFGEVLYELSDVLSGRTLVAHNVGFDYAFLAAEAELVNAALPTDAVMCTVELARRLDLGLANLKLETLAAHWGVVQERPHDALDDAMVLTKVLAESLHRAQGLDIWLPVRPVTRRRWPNGRVTHDTLHPLKALAGRIPCSYANPGRFIEGQPLVQGMRVALAADGNRTQEEIVERLLHAGLAYTEAVDEHTSLVICNHPEPRQGKGVQARRLGIPTISDVRFLEEIGSVAGGSRLDEFVRDDAGSERQQLALF